MQIMTVDDSRSVRLSIALTLKQAGYRVIEAETGEVALELLKTEKVDLIISDLNMPGMDGIELVRRIKKEPVNSAIPVIMLTTEHLKGRLSEANEVGAIGWMHKPFKAEHLVAAVKTISKKLGIS